MTRQTRYSPAARARAVRMMFEHRGEHALPWAAIGSISSNSRAVAGERDPAEGVGVLCGGGARPPVEAMIAFIDDHRDLHGVGPICRLLPIAPSTYLRARRSPARSRDAAGASQARR